MFTQNYNLGYPANFLIQAPPTYAIGGIQVDANGFVIINDVQGRVLGGGTSQFIDVGVAADVIAWSGTPTFNADGLPAVADSPVDAKLATFIESDGAGKYRFSAGGVANVATSSPSAIAAAVAAALAGQAIIVQSPIGKGTLEITAKDAYLSTDGRALVWSKPTGANWPTDLTGWSITFTATRNVANNPNTGTATITTSGTVVTATGAQQVQVELASTLTTGLAAGIGNQGYDFDVVATKTGDRATLIKGTMTVLANVTA